MKAIKIIAVALLIAMLGCTFIACDTEKEPEKPAAVEKDTTPAPIGTPSEGLTEMKVSFSIKDSSGTNIYRAVDYTYKGFDPTILGVLKYYFDVELGEYIATYEEEGLTDMLQFIGDYEAAEGQYWAALKGDTFFDAQGKEISVKNLLKSENKKIFESYMISSMSAHTLTDGETFTVVLAGTKTVAEEPAE